MGKKYLNTKEGSLEQSVLGVWKRAAEKQDEVKEGDNRLKANRAENEKNEAWEVGTDEYRKYLERITPGEIAEHKKGEDLDTEPGKTSNKIKRANEPKPAIATEEKGDKEAYQKFFNSALKKFGVKSPAELDDSKKKEFYDYVDKNWKADDEQTESLIKDFKIQSMRDKLMQVWNVKEDSVKPSYFGNKKKSEGKTDTGKKVAKVDVDPEMEEKKKKVWAGKSY